MAVGHDHIAVGVGEVVGQTADLRALAAVGRAAAVHQRGAAVAAVAHAQGTVDESLKAHVGYGLVDGAYLRHRHLARKHHATHAQRGEEAHLVDGSRVALRGSVQGYGRYVHAQECHVLDDESVDTGGKEGTDGLARLGEFVLVDERVEGDVDAGAVTVGIAAHLAYVVDGVGGGGTCAMIGTAHVDGIGAAVDGGDGHLAVAGGSKQLEAADCLFHFPFFLRTEKPK